MPTSAGLVFLAGRQVKRSPRRRVCVSFVAPRGARRKETGAPYRRGFRLTLVHPSSAAEAFPFSSNWTQIIHVSIRNGLSPPSAVKTHSGGILVAGKALIYTCGGRREREREMESKEEERGKLFFFTLVLNWFCCLLPSNCNPL